MRKIKYRVLPSLNEFIISDIEQFTGFYDKNGKEIYENDVLSFGREQKYKVVFTEGCFYLYHHEGSKEIDGTAYRWGLLNRTKELDLEIEIIK